VPRKPAWFFNSHAIDRNCHRSNISWGTWALNCVGTGLKLVMYRIDCDSGGLMEQPQHCPMVRLVLIGIEPFRYETRLLFASSEVFILV
jgi:hypothetical protein